MRITEGVIIAAGLGKRLGMGIPKALVEVAGAPLLSRVLWTFRQLGLTRAVVVVGHRAEEVRARFSHPARTFGLDLEFVYNPRYEGGNGLSVLCAKDRVGERFVLSMVDHIFDPEVLKGMLDVEEGDIVIAVDSKPQLVDHREATKVRIERGRVVAIGKGVYPFDAVDCGIFVCTSAIFPAIERMSKDLEEWNDAKQILAERGAALAYDIRGAFWLDVDTPEDLERAERLVKERFGCGLS
ncbi:MAG: hypothetical protein DRQ08_01705 [Candidatus Latescibacterota bacterium]|nr:MAG: hypothetical protein DRQ08_01705 [Candidatus Latescibacterota bacterium]